jgi:hypothetical protein
MTDEQFKEAFERAIARDIENNPFWWIMLRDSIPYLIVIGIVIFFITHPDFGKKYYFEKSNKMTIELGTTEDLVFTVKDLNTYRLTGETYAKVPDGVDSIFDYLSFDRSKEQVTKNGDTYKVSIPIKGIKKTNTYIEDGHIEFTLSSKSNAWGVSEKDTLKVYVK